MSPAEEKLSGGTQCVLWGCMCGTGQFPKHEGTSVNKCVGEWCAWGTGEVQQPQWLSN